MINDVNGRQANGERKYQNIGLCRMNLQFLQRMFRMFSFFVCRRNMHTLSCPFRIQAWQPSIRHEDILLESLYSKCIFLRLPQNIFKVLRMWRRRRSKKEMRFACAHDTSDIVEIVDIRRRCTERKRTIHLCSPNKLKTIIYCLSEIKRTAADLWRESTRTRAKFFNLANSSLLFRSSRRCQMQRTNTRVRAHACSKLHLTSFIAFLHIVRSLDDSFSFWARARFSLRLLFMSTTMFGSAIFHSKQADEEEKIQRFRSQTNDEESVDQMRKRFVFHVHSHNTHTRNDDLVECGKWKRPAKRKKRFPFIVFFHRLNSVVMFYCEQANKTIIHQTTKTRNNRSTESIEEKAQRNVSLEKCKNKRRTKYTFNGQ